MAKIASFIKQREDPEFEEFISRPMEISCTPEDQVFLEDESGKVELDPQSKFENSLHFKLSVHSFNTGNFIRVKGRMQSNFKFLAEEIIFLHDTQESQTHLQSSLKVFLVAGLNLS